MIEHVYRRAAAARRVRSVVVATDDRRIADVVEAFGGVVRMTAAHHRSGTDRVAEVARDLDCDLVVNVQGDEPLIEPAAIDDAIAPFDQDPSLVMCTLRTLLVTPSDVNDPDVVKVVVDARGDALYFSRSPIPFARPRQNAAGDARARIFKHLGLYVYRRAFAIEVAGLTPTPLECAESLEQLRVLEHGFRIRTVETSHDSVGVDTPADLERVRRSLTAAALTVSTHNAAT
jgi:3-deoxy-manno-octulosonate cytidylyltransferase (CMP-KDO synthetase)